MATTSTYSTNQLRDYASLFSRNQVLAWQSGDFSGIRAILIGKYLSFTHA